LRILEMGEQVIVSLVDRAAPGIDTPEDLGAFRQRLARA
jgi:CMP-2-keto-3-deoxyoctulosonic acid synthetase